MKKKYIFVTAFLAFLLLTLWTSIKATAASSSNTVVWSLICPDDVTVDCNAELWDLSIYGNAQYHDHLGYHPAGSPTVHRYISSCGGGYITRTWTVEDPYWNNHTCTQTITVGNGVGFDANSIDWPDYVTLEGCNPNTHPDVTGKPTWVPSECSMLGHSYSDMLFTVTSGCKKIMRKWTVIDWCMTGNTNYPNSWTYTQVIKIIENTPPVFDCLKDITVSSFDCKFGKVIAPPLMVDPATCGGNYQITNNSPYAKEKLADLSGNYPLGTTKVTYTVKYGCGEKKTCLVNVVVKSKAPVPVCVGSMSIALMGIDSDNDGINDKGMVQLWAKDLNWKSYSTCGNEPLRYSFSPNVNDMSKVFTCDHIGKQKVKMYVTDTKGAQSYCETEIDFQNNGANIKDCKPAEVIDPNRKYTARGLVTDAFGYGLKLSKMELINTAKQYKYNITYDTAYTVVTDSFKNLSGYWVYFHDKKTTVTSKKDSVLIESEKFGVLTDDKGNYIFDKVMTKGQSYMIKCPEINLPLIGIDKADLDALTNHVLGTKIFDKMYQYIAADVDKNGKVDLEDINVLLKYLTGDIQKFSDSDWLVTSLASLKMNMKISDIVNWVGVDKIEKDAEKIDFTSIQLGNIIPESYSGNISASELEASVRSLIPSEEESRVEVSPNPFILSFEIKIHSNQKSNAVIQLYDLSGRVVLIKQFQIKQGENSFDMDGKELQSGMYIYKVQMAHKEFTGKIIKQS